jgi:hypothetical protein
VTLELGADACVVRAQERTHVLRIEALGPLREADEIAEERSHDLALLASRRLLSKRGAAHPAQAESVGVLLATARTGDHG